MDSELKLANGCEHTARVLTFLGLLPRVGPHSVYLQVCGYVCLVLTSGPIALYVKKVF